MRLLLDECLPVELTEHLSGHDVRTVRQMGWLGIKNGRLLKLIAESGQFDAFVTWIGIFRTNRRSAPFPLPS